ncbi:Shootin-1 [Channa argus]|uniref:Shootin-1 n=1 Tax=Channa argus TaxID=215402 RepID=A0A6G1PW97_CHAAH|nr:Shootin-1 [Channa argus]
MKKRFRLLLLSLLSPLTLSSELNCENRKLKYLSMSSRPCLDELLPSISDCIALEAEADTDAADSSPDTFTQYQQQVKELRETVNSLLEEKKNFVCQIHDQQRQIEELTIQSEKDKAEMKELRETVEQQSKTIKRFNRVSTMAAQEYEGMKEQLDLEQSLRVKAETYAHEMLVKQKEANRQSMLLLQSAEPSVQLLKALEDVAAITKTMEEERLQHQQKVLQRQLELLEVEKKEVEGQLEQTVTKNKELEKRAAEGVDDVKVKAVNEMMERIKHGVVLRPVKSQENKQPPVIEEKQQESAMDELKGILETVKRSPSRSSQESGPSPLGKKDSELELILRRRRNKAGEAGSGDENGGQMSHVSSSDSLNGKCSSSDSGKDPEGVGGLSVPSDPAGPRVSPERRGSGPGPIVARRKSSDTGQEPRVGSWQERRSRSSLSEKETAESPFSNGCINSVGEDDRNVAEKCVQSNGVDHVGAGEEAPASICADPVNGSTDAEC